MSNEIEEKLFEKIFGHTLIKLSDKLINTTDRKGNQIIVKNILKSKDKIFEKYYFDDWVIESSDQGINLKDAINLILDFNENKNEDEYENDDDKTIHKIIDEWKPFKDQIKSLKKREDLKKYYPHKDYDDKELKHKYCKIKLADVSNEIDEKLFEKIFGHTLIKLVDKLINTTNKEENPMIFKNINANKIKLDKQKNVPLWLGDPTNLSTQ